MEWSGVFIMPISNRGFAAFEASGVVRRRLMDDGGHVCVTSCRRGDAGFCGDENGMEKVRLEEGGEEVNHVCVAVTLVAAMFWLR